MTADMSGTPSSSSDLPIVIGSCFGWWHQPSRETRLDRGVVLCSPYGHEAVCTHRNWRALAVALADAGLPTVRFDYPGTGDSAGSENSEQLSAWLDSITAAISWLRQHAGVHEVALCGLRFGALLAAQAASTHDHEISRLALLAPVLSGRAFVRELYVRQHMAESPPAGAEWLEASGTRLHHHDLLRLEAMDIGSALSSSRVRSLLVLEPPWRRGIADTLRTTVQFPAATQIVSQPFTGLAELMREAYLASTPSADFTVVARWLRKEAERSHYDVHRAVFSHTSLAIPDGIEERAVRFGVDGGLFGILATPRTVQNAANAPPCALVVNAGASHRVGNSRFAVLLARHLAALGMASFRVDLTGLGDSTRAALGPEGGGVDAYRTARIRLYRSEFCDDVFSAIDELERHGYATCNVIGVCSGANLALHSALGDRRITGVVMVNPTFFDRSHNKLETTGHAPLWRRAAGRTRDAVLTSVRSARRKILKPQLRNRAATMWWQIGTLAYKVLADADQAVDFWFNADWAFIKAVKWIRQLMRHRVDMLFIFSENDPGLHEWNAYLAWMCRTTRHGYLPHPVVVDGSNHVFEPLTMRDRLIDIIIRHFTRQYGLGVANSEPRSVASPEFVPAPAPLTGVHGPR